ERLVRGALYPFGALGPDRTGPGPEIGSGGRADVVLLEGRALLCRSVMAGHGARGALECHPGGNHVRTLDALLIAALPPAVCLHDSARLPEVREELEDDRCRADTRLVGALRSG